MIPEQFDIEIDRELAHTREAQSTGNTGKARTTARRAVGCVLNYWLEKYPHISYIRSEIQR